MNQRQYLNLYPHVLIDEHCGFVIFFVIFLCLIGPTALGINEKKKTCSILLNHSMLNLVLIERKLGKEKFKKLNIKTMQKQGQ